MRLLASALVMVLLIDSVSADDKKEKPKPPPEKTEVEYKSTTHGAIQVNGTTGDWFTVYRGKKNVGPAVPPKVGSTAEIAPGEYDVFVNKTKRTVTVKVGTKVVLETGTLVVEGKGADWWTPYEGKERRVVSNPPILGSAIALFPGTYSIHLRVDNKDVTLTDNAKVEAARKTTLNFKK